MRRALVGIIASANSEVVAPFVADAVEFDGVNDWLARGAQLTGATDSTNGTVSAWLLKPNTGDNVDNYFLDLSEADVGLRIYVARDGHATAPGSLVCIAKATGNVANFTLFAEPGAFNMIDGKWHHVLMSWNATTTSLYVDDVNAQSSPPTPTGAAIDYTHADCGLGSIWNGTGKFNGELADVFFTSEYLDLSVEANRRKFITNTGTPADLGVIGQLPTGTSPLIYFKGDAASWNAGTNTGSGGDFVMTGAVTDSLNEPVQVQMPFEQAVAFNGDNTYFDIVGTTGLADSQTMTFNVWMYYTASSLNEIFYVTSSNTDGNSWRAIIRSGNGPNNFDFTFKNAAGATTLNHIAVGLLSPGEWNHICYSCDLATLTSHFYINDEAVPNGPTIITTAALDLTSSFAFLSGRSTASTAGNMDGSLAEYYFGLDYIDISIEANRRKFISSTGNPVPLGGDGSLPTGTSPLIYMTGEAAVWNAGTNAGSGGNYTMVGAVTDSVDEPVHVAVPFPAQAVEFDGTNDYLETTTGLNGITDNNLALASVWLYYTGGNPTFYITSGGSSNANDNLGLQFYIGAAFLNVVLWNGAASPSTVFQQQFSTTLTSNAWNHVLISRNAGDWQFYLNDASAGTATGATTQNTLWTQPNILLSGTHANKAQAQWEPSEFYITNEYLDLSIVENRRKFITASGKPVFLGADGSTPTGNQPAIFFSGGQTTFGNGINAGSGGNFTPTGTILDSNNLPVEV